jgi:outer membrane receptor protein involved in Fe transport
MNHLKRDESLIRNHIGNYLSGLQFTSELKQTSTAIYTELSTQLDASTNLTYGFRIEDWTNNYQDSGSIDENETETLWGGKITLEHMLNSFNLAYGSLAHGYKAGGVNSSPKVSIENRTFNTETNNSVEMGLKSSLLDDSLTTRFAVFYIQRTDQQVKSSSPETVGTTTVWKEYLSNAAEGRNYGIEVELNWLITPAVSWDLSTGLLKTEFTDYSYTDENNVFINKDGDTQAHAPEYTIATGLNFQLQKHISLRVESEAKDEFYFSDSNYEKSKSYTLIHAQLQYKKDNLTVSLNGHNLTDEDYAVRGFGFDNDPRTGNKPTQHIQLAAPRLVSLSSQYNF